MCEALVYRRCGFGRKKNTLSLFRKINRNNFGQQIPMIVFSFSGRKVWTAAAETRRKKKEIFNFRGEQWALHGDSLTYIEEESTTFCFAHSFCFCISFCDLASNDMEIIIDCIAHSHTHTNTHRASSCAQIYVYIYWICITYYILHWSLIDVGAFVRTFQLSLNFSLLPAHIHVCMCLWAWVW